MDIRQLKYFVQVADSGTYSLASQKLFVSQPALSKTIKGIEEELGFTLFYSHQRRQYLTDRGQILYDKAVHLIKEYNSLMETAYDESGIEKGHLTIGMSGSTGSSSLFGHIYPGLAAKHPMIDFTTVEKATSTLKEEIYKRDIDAAYIDLMYLRKDEENLFDIYKIVESDLVAVVSAANPFASINSLKYTDFNEKPLILFQSEDTSSNQLALDIRTSVSKPRLLMTSSQWHFIFDLVEVDLGMTIAPYYIFERLRVPGIKYVPIDEPSARRTIALIAKKDENRSRVLKAFIEYASKPKYYQDLNYHFKV